VLLTQATRGLRIVGGEAERDPGGEKMPSPASAKLASEDVAKYVSGCVGLMVDASNWGEMTTAGGL
jgi:hypothetical protein